MIKQFFIVSTGRTATRALARTRDQIPGQRATHEARPEARDISNRRWDGDLSAIEARDWIAASIERYERLTSPAGVIAGKRGIKRICAAVAHAVSNKYERRATIDSNCLTWNFIDLLDEVCQRQIGFIYVYRDAAATIDSMFNSPFYVSQGSVPWERRAQRGFIDITADGYSEADRLRNCRYGYRIRTERIEAALAQIDRSRQLLVRFEDLVVRPQAFSEVAAFLSRLSGIAIAEPPQLMHLHQGPTYLRAA
ncbi:MAG: hypothetical protein AAF961_03300 [Planctomycetota bacterium]